MHHFETLQSMNNKEKISNKNENELKEQQQQQIKLKQWVTHRNCIMYLDEYIKSSKIAAFDMDYTVIKTKSGKIFPQHVDDWVWWHKTVPDKLVELHQQGYHVVLFTNQAFIQSGASFSVEWYNQITTKIRNIANLLQIPINAFISPCEDEMRKPRRGMWDLMIEVSTLLIEPFDIKQCYYIGDAAGRPDHWKPGVKGDFSDSDLEFAKNIGVDFHTPEVFFLGESPYIHHHPIPMVSSKPKHSKK
ncbi:SAP DNA-binding domain-containing protein [Tieghemostelium lacteum]|uniref:SAP DNA-binding domain-containing protein n=1 Tax=Tieghemostelium lacteum TaxID=361077 RepID=A0A152A4B6_TIELA|nr:SAP DNA-binding domain-containing protein [Tieghemostelium lacteum]|eukprot:KYR00917.1 SAP DNA-binding domain-containing protein [Tieghemostelium lacteum]